MISVVAFVSRGRLNLFCLRCSYKGVVGAGVLRKTILVYNVTELPASLRSG